MLRGRRACLSGALVVCLSASLVGGCFGRFVATRNLWEFNKGVHKEGIVQSLVMIGLSIVPVYELFVLADVLVLNSIEYWTKKNPLEARRDAAGPPLAWEADGPAAITAQRDGHVLRIEARPDGKNEVRLDGALVATAEYAGPDLLVYDASDYFRGYVPAAELQSRAARTP